MEYRKLPAALANHGDFGKAAMGPVPTAFTPEMKAQMEREEQEKQNRLPLARHFKQERSAIRG